MNKKIKLLIAIGILIVLGFVVGTSYAIWIQFYSQQGTNVVNSSCFETVFTEDSNSSIQLNDAFPMLDDDGKKLKPYTFLLKNNCNNEVQYQLNLETTNRTTISDSYIKIMVNNNVPILLTNNAAINPTIANGRSGYNLDIGMLRAQETKNFSIRLWMDENIGPDDIDAMNGTFESKITVTTSYYVLNLADAMLVNENQSASVEEAKEAIKNKKAPDFTKPAPIVENDIESPESDKGLYQAMDDDGETYYYRGNVTNNYVKFADSYWRIIRLNGDGSIRLLYAGTTSNATGANLGIGSLSPFNSIANNPAYAGYMYGKNLGVSYADTVKNEVSNTIKTKVDAWYVDNVLSKGLGSRVADSIFCNDREVHSGNGYTTDVTTNYKPNYRYFTTKIPTYSCRQANDRFTVSSEKGNGALTYPIGLVTVDDLMYAGITTGFNNTKSYIYSSQHYWTMSPMRFNANNYESNFFLNSSGSVDSYWITGNNGVRPVINLKADIQISGGSGISSDPFVVI